MRRALFLGFFVLLAWGPRTQGQDPHKYLLVPQYETGERWVTIEMQKRSYHSLVGQLVMPISEWSESRSKFLYTVVDADRQTGDLRRLDMRCEYAYTEGVPANQTRKVITYEPYHGRVIHVEKTLDDFGVPDLHATVEGTAVTPEIEQFIKGEFRVRRGLMPKYAVAPGDTWTVTNDDQIHSVFGGYAAGSLQMRFDEIGIDPDTHQRVAVVKYSGDILERVPMKPGIDPRDAWEKRADRWNDQKAKLVGSRSAENHDMHLTGTLWVDLATRRVIRSDYEGTIQTTVVSDANHMQDPSKGDMVKRGDVKGMLRSKPLPKHGDGDQAKGGGPPPLTVFHDPGGRFQIEFPEGWQADADAARGTVRIVPANEQFVAATVAVKPIDPNATPAQAWVEIAKPRIQALPFPDPTPPEPLDISGLHGMAAFYKYRAAENPQFPGRSFRGSMMVVVSGKSAYLLDFVAPIDRFPDLVSDFGQIRRSFKILAGNAGPAAHPRKPAAQPVQPPNGAAKPQPVPAAPAAYRDPKGRFSFGALAGFEPARDAGGALALFRPKDGAEGVEITVREENGDADPKSVVSKILRRAVERGAPYTVLYQGTENGSYIAIVSRAGARARIEAIPARGDKQYFVLSALAPSAKEYQKRADDFDKILGSFRH